MSIINYFKEVFSSRSKISTDEDMLSLGSPVVRLRDESGNIIQEHASSNLVLDTGRNALVRMLAGDYSQKILLVELGTAGVAENDPWTPLPPSSSDPGILGPVTPIAQKEISGYEYDAGVNPDKVSFSVIFESYEVDAIVSEAVLKFEDGKPYARYTFPAAYLKADKGYSLEVIWASKFAAK